MGFTPASTVCRNFSGRSQSGQRKAGAGISGFRVTVVDRIRRGPRPLRGVGASSLTQATEQPSGGITAEKSRAVSGRVVPFSRVEVSVRSNSHDKVLVACDLPEFVVQGPTSGRIVGFTVYSLATIARSHPPVARRCRSITRLYNFLP